MGEPDVTCVIPTFNDRVNLPRAVQSALAQEGVRVEVILVDDCSDADTRAFIAQLASQDERITPFFLPDNGGQGRARNIGAMLARSRYVVFLDQDDEHAPGWYQLAAGHLDATPTLGVLSGMARFVDLPARFGIDETDLRLRGLSLVFITNIVFRKSVFLATGGFPLGGLWRSRIAGEDGTYRTGLARNWNMVQCGDAALLHRVKEGGATAFFLDRSEVKDNRVVIQRYELIESNGELQQAQEAFWALARQRAEEVRNCVKASA